MAALEDDFDSLELCLGDVDWEEKPESFEDFFAKQSLGKELFQSKVFYEYQKGVAIADRRTLEITHFIKDHQSRIDIKLPTGNTYPLGTYARDDFTRANKDFKRYVSYVEKGFTIEVHMDGSATLKLKK